MSSIFSTKADPLCFQGEFEKRSPTYSLLYNTMPARYVKLWKHKLQIHKLNQSLLTPPIPTHISVAPEPQLLPNIPLSKDTSIPSIMPAKRNRFLESLSNSHFIIIQNVVQILINTAYHFTSPPTPSSRLAKSPPAFSNDERESASEKIPNWKIFPKKHEINYNSIALASYTFDVNCQMKTSQSLQRCWWIKCNGEEVDMGRKPSNKSSKLWLRDLM